MVKKITGDASEKKELSPKRLKIKALHRGVRQERAELEKLPPEQLPPASSGNAARQIRSRLNNTFPVNWLELHKERPEEESE
jgi:hypothetical protein